MPIDPKWYSDQIKEFIARQPQLEALREALDARLAAEAKTLLGPAGIVQSRTKSVASFAEKVIRKSGRYADPVNQLTDLCGVRVIAETSDQVQAFCRFVARSFEIHEDEDVSGRLRSGEFGYLSRHYIVSFKAGTEGIDPMLWERYSPDDTVRASHLIGPKLKAELQVRTLLQHAWATVCHDTLYKGGFKPPRASEREAGRIAALLEDADESFGRLIGTIESYRTSYGAYMKPEEILQEIEKLEIVRDHDPLRDPRLAQRIARLAMSVGNWEKAATALESHAMGRSAASVLRDYGVACWRWRQQEQASVTDPNALPGGPPEPPDGRELLERAVELDPEDVDALCSLAETWEGVDEEKVRDYYQRAFRVSPADPRALGGYLVSKIVNEKRYDFVQLMYPSLDTAIKRCRQRASLRVDLPRAFYEIGLFSLLLGRPFESLSALAKAIDLSQALNVVDAARYQASRLRSALDKALPELDWMIGFLFLARVAQLRARKRTAGAPADGSRLGNVPDRDLAELGRRATSGLFIEGPVVVVAGSCDPTLDRYLSDFKALLRQGFEGFRGTILSGGTRAGISAWIGDLEGEGIRKLAHLPGGELPEDAQEDERYEIVRMAEEREFSPLQPLQYWTDILFSGIAPEDVRLIGVGGGAISAFEYRLALALGARVGVLRDSGRAAEELIHDPDWDRAAGLAALPSDPATVRLFLQPVKHATILEEADRERLARATHDAFRNQKRQDLVKKDLAMSDWEKLREDFREDNLSQVDSIEAKLRSIGLGIRKVVGREPVLMTFTDDEVERMAEFEHGRWNVTRLLQGWRLGPTDKERRISEYLVSWSELPDGPDGIKKFDRIPVLGIPEMLKKIGYEVVRP